MESTDIAEPKSKRARNISNRMSADSPPPTKDDIRLGLRQAKAGEGRPARQVLQEIRDELATDVDNR
ncbi:MAG: hypothetical protein OXG78_06885 [Chloroflexi bacterium]|nr:hypothetical protein [Chloroflexota bacterium]